MQDSSVPSPHLWTSKCGASRSLSPQRPGRIPGAPHPSLARALAGGGLGVSRPALAAALLWRRRCHCAGFLLGPVPRTPRAGRQASLPGPAPVRGCSQSPSPPLPQAPRTPAGLWGFCGRLSVSHTTCICMHTQARSHHTRIHKPHACMHTALTCTRQAHPCMCTQHPHACTHGT